MQNTFDFIGFFLVLAGEETFSSDQSPDSSDGQKANKHGSRTYIFGAAREFVLFVAVPIDSGFNCRVDQLDNEDQE